MRCGSCSTCRPNRPSSRSPSPIWTATAPRWFWHAPIVEGLLLIGWYFPGTLVVIFAFVAAGPDAARLAELAAAAGLGLFAAYLTNFFAGKFGWYRLLLAFGLREPLENAQRRLTKYGLSAICTTYWQANLASCISTAAGILQFPFGRFAALSFLAEAFWISFWATLIFFLGKAALSLAGFRIILFAILIWIAVAADLALEARPIVYAALRASSASAR